jgi:hypothetical protein
MNIEQTKRFISRWHAQQKAINPLRILFKGLSPDQE